MRSWAESKGIEQNKEDINYLTVDSHLASVLLSSISYPDIRQRLWVGLRTVNFHNAEVLAELIVLRSEIAKMTGFASYSHKFLANKVHRSPEEVIGYLRDVSEAISAKAKREYRLMLKFHDYNKGEKSRQVETVHPWDFPYLLNMTRQDATINSKFADLNDLSAYFPIDRCISGFALICKKVFGVDVIPCEFDEGESWANVQGSDGSNRLYKFKILKDSESAQEEPAILYLDLFARHNKYSGSAHFNIRSGCYNSFPHGKQELACDNSDISVGSSISRQSAIVGLVMNFRHPSDKSSSETRSPHHQYCLSFNELQIFYHELGHAMHSILSRTHYQHLSGTRGPVDIVEVSHRERSVSFFISFME